MGYYRRRAGEELVKLLAAMLGFALVSFWPYIAGTAIAKGHGARPGSTTYELAGWLPEVAWIALLVGGTLYVTAHRRRSRAAAQSAYVHHVGQMAVSGAPWFDQRAGHFRHGRCTIRHRSMGAAMRCRSTV